MSRQFRRTGGNHPGRSVFDLSHEKKLTCDMGQLIPILCEEMVPGDKFIIGNEIVVRMQPLVAPILHRVDVTCHYFFVPNRLLMDEGEWEDFISGGVDGDSDVSLPVWEGLDSPTVNGKYTLYDYFGFPVGINPVGCEPLCFPKRAYNLVYNEYYRDQNQIEELDLDNDKVLNRAWEKDYFTSALPWQQRGTAASIELSGHLHALWPEDLDVMAYVGDGYRKTSIKSLPNQLVGQGSPQTNYFNRLGYVIGHPSTFEGPGQSTTRDWADVDRTSYVAEGGVNVYAVDQNQSLGETLVLPSSALNANTIDSSKIGTFDVADLRRMFQIQKWMERNARTGVRYTEFLKAHFGVSPRDDRLQRPEYVGGSKSPVVISEVLQTSESRSTSSPPQGTMAGHGITADRTHVSKYYAQEFGWIIGIMSIMPKPAYHQGINRQFLRRTRYDYYFPEFANLSEQLIENVEICATGNEAHNKGEFGFQGRYDEMRYKPNMICADMRDLFDYWHLGRTFDVNNPPALNKEFIECVCTQENDMKRIFAVQDEPGLIVNVANIIKAIRPIPIMSNPGLIDH